MGGLFSVNVWLRSRASGLSKYWSGWTSPECGAIHDHAAISQGPNRRLARSTIGNRSRIARRIFNASCLACVKSGIFGTPSCSMPSARFRVSKISDGGTSRMTFPLSSTSITISKSGPNAPSRQRARKTNQNFPCNDEPAGAWSRYTDASLAVEIARLKNQSVTGSPRPARVGLISWPRTLPSTIFRISASIGSVPNGANLRVIRDKNYVRFAAEWIGSCLLIVNDFHHSDVSWLAPKTLRAQTPPAWCRNATQSR